MALAKFYEDLLRIREANAYALSRLKTTAQEPTITPPGTEHAVVVRAGGAFVLAPAVAARASSAELRLAVVREMRSAVEATLREVLSRAAAWRLIATHDEQTAAESALRDELIALQTLTRLVRGEAAALRYQLTSGFGEGHEASVRVGKFVAAWLDGGDEPQREASSRRQRLNEAIRKKHPIGVVEAPSPSGPAIVMANAWLTVELLDREADAVETLLDEAAMREAQRLGRVSGVDA